MIDLLGDLTRHIPHVELSNNTQEKLKTTGRWAAGTLLVVTCGALVAYCDPEALLSAVSTEPPSRPSSTLPTDVQRSLGFPTPQIHR